VTQAHLPDGTVLDFPDNTPDSIIDNTVKQHLGTQSSAIDNALQGKLTPQREQEINSAMDAYRSGEQGMTQTGLQLAGKGSFGLAADVAGDIMSRALNATPDVVKEGAESVFSTIGSIPAPDILGNPNTMGGLVSGSVQGVASAYGDAKERFPNAMRTVESVTNIGSTLLPFKYAASSGVIPKIEQAVAPVVKGTAKGVAAVAKAPFKAVGSTLEYAGSKIPLQADEGLSDIALAAYKRGIPLSVNQVVDSKPLNAIQKVSQELPFSGYQGFREKQMKEWQKQLFQTVGVDADRFTQKTMNKAFKSVGGEFDSLTKGKEFNIGADFIQRASELKDDISSQLGNEAAEAFEKQVLRVINDFKDGDVITGELLSRQRSRLNSLARGAKAENKSALLQLEGLLSDSITSQDPILDAALSQAKKKYKNLIVLEPLANKAKGGFISPTLLDNRVSAVYKRAHTIGESGDIGELAKIGRELLPELGGSDTVSKGLYATGLGLGLAPVNRPYQALFNQSQKTVGKALGLSKQEIKQIMKMKPKDARKLLEGK
jgi:hypothetical protein